MRIANWIIALAFSATTALAGENWPQFRGPAGDGHSDATGLPLTWSETENVAWKTPIHDRGWSSPVVWENAVWLTTATADGKRLYAVCVDARSGGIIHDVKVFDVEEPEHVAAVNSYASPTPVVEAGRVYVHYGTYGTACLDTASGKVLWARNDLKCDHHEGPGSSPILFENLLIFHVDGCDVQYAIALDKATGKTVWRADRAVDYANVHPFHRKAFCTPTVFEAGGRLQLISPCSKAMFAYDPRSGEELWKVCHRGWSIAPRPLFGHGLLFVVMDYVRPELWAVRPGGRGDLTDSNVVWKTRKGMPRRPSFLLLADHIYLVSDDGIAACVEAESGEIVWRRRLEGDYSASLLFADGRIHFFSHDCVATVIEPGRECKVLAENRLDGRMMASPAVAGKTLFLRTEKHLYGVEKTARIGPRARSQQRLTIP